MAKAHGHRRSIRLPDFDYSQEGWYVVTLITHSRNPYFKDPLLQRIAEENFLHLPEQYPALVTDAWAVMPDHVHFVVRLEPPAHGPGGGSTTEGGDRVAGVRAQLNCALASRALTHPTPPIPPIRSASPIGTSFSIDPLRPTLGQIVRTYKARVTRRAHQSGEDGFQWQRNYSERVIRGQEEPLTVRKYILLNPDLRRLRSSFETK